MFLQFLVNGIVAGSVYALVAAGFSLIYRTSRFLNFAHGAVYTAGAYCAFSFTKQIGLPFWVSFVGAVLLAAGIGALLETTVYGPMRRVGAGTTALFVSSLGLFIAIQNLISLMWGDEVKLLRSDFIGESWFVFGARITSIQTATVLAAIVTWGAIFVLLRRSSFGRTVRAVATDAVLARTVGIRSDLVILAVMTIGAALAGVAGILVALDTDLTPVMGFNPILMAVLAVVVGGTRRFLGTIVGAYFIGLVEHLGVFMLPTQWQRAILLLVLLIFLTLRSVRVLPTRTKEALA